jgi:Family of unknown function (DUF6527)
MKRYALQLLSAVHSILFRTYSVRFVSELPEVYRARVLYVVGENAPWSVALQCPCKCNDVIHLSLLEDDAPKWSLKFEWFGAASLSPSVWRTVACRSHFFLRKGYISWLQPMNGLSIRSKQKCGSYRKES